MPPAGLLERSDLSDHELLLLVAHSIAEVKDLISGNGQPGIVVRLSRLEGRGDRKTRAKGGAVGTVFSFAVMLLARLFGVSV